MDARRSARVVHPQGDDGLQVEPCGVGPSRAQGTPEHTADRRLGARVGGIEAADDDRSLSRRRAGNDRHSIEGGPDAGHR